jgi:hypothetical protein
MKSEQAVLPNPCLEEEEEEEVIIIIERNRPLGRPEHRWKNISKWIIQKYWLAVWILLN